MSDRPLPDPKAFGAEVRRRMLTDRELQAQYTFIEKREEIKATKLGKVSAGPVKTYEVYPSVERGNTYKRLIAVNGVPVPPAELEQQDRTHREDVLREAAKRERETPEERQRRVRDEERTASSGTARSTRSSSCTTSASSAARSSTGTPRSSRRSNRSRRTGRARRRASG